MKISTLLILLAAVNMLAVPMISKAENNSIISPNGQLKVTFTLDSVGRPYYSVQLNDKEVIKPSRLGLQHNDQAFITGLSLETPSRLEDINDDYTMIMGKRRKCSYRAKRRTFTLKNKAGRLMQLVFQVSNDGLAFRYVLPVALDKTLSIEREETSFAFARDTVAWLHPIQPAKSGWCKTQPSYEEYYVIGKPVGTPSPMSEGWCFPALFKTAENIWVLICDSDVDENYCAMRLAKRSTGGVYRIAFPHPKEHRGTIDPVKPVITTPFQSPWRVLIVGDDLNTLVGSTLVTDVAQPSKVANIGFIKPGKAAWHWLRYDNDSSTLEYAHAYLDFAAKMKWDYILIDVNWDQNIGYEKMAAFVKQAKSKNVDVLLWYNSNGPWNDASMTPINKMHERDVRRREFALLWNMGVTGVKIDFFGGDKQATVKLYTDIFKDAANFGLLVNCHGTTIPRGWQRTWPNLVTMEAVRGMEYCTFTQQGSDEQARHCCILPFTRNVIGSMDFTPLVFNPHIRDVNLRTSPGFELALSIVFESGVQHFGLSPGEFDLMPDYVLRYLQTVPTVWDETFLLEGYPGDYVVMARRFEENWYIGGISCVDKELTLDLSFLPEDADATMITDGSERRFTKTTLSNETLKKQTLKMQANSGFVILVGE